MTARLVEACLRLGDDALIAAQRLAEWSARAPEMEEDVALSNIALDQLGVARMLLTHAGQLEDAGRDEDCLAFLRGPSEFRNCLLVELPNARPAGPGERWPDFGVTMAKLLFLSTYQRLLYDALVDSTDDFLGGVAGKARKESAYHVDHAAQWTVRLGAGTEASHQRMWAALLYVWPYTHELFETDALTADLARAGVMPEPSTLRPQWLEEIGAVVARATLSVPDLDTGPHGGRQGQHTEHLTDLLAELQQLHREHPGARW